MNRRAYDLPQVHARARELLETGHPLGEACWIAWLAGRRAFTARYPLDLYPLRLGALSQMVAEDLRVRL
ncbi:MAG: hypothetical protein KGJ12_06070 [Gammaproteobacteria bacterium]|nr:hypothetical protein [Gammaproteobacteria bacterium]